MDAHFESPQDAGGNNVYDITVTDQHGALVAEFRGRSFTTNRTLPTASK